MAIDYGIRNCGISTCRIYKHKIDIIRCESVSLTLDPYKYLSYFDTQIKSYIDEYLKHGKVHIIHEYQPRFNKRTSILEFATITLLKQYYGNKITQESIHPRVKQAYLKRMLNTDITTYSSGKKASINFLYNVHKLYSPINWLVIPGKTNLTSETIYCPLYIAETLSSKRKCKNKVKDVIKTDDMADALVYCLLVFSSNFINKY